MGSTPSTSPDDPTLSSFPGAPPAQDMAGDALPARIGDYAIYRELGRGGMGVVYLAQDPRLQRDVALKLLPPGLAAHPATRDAFFAEARALAAVNDPYIATIFTLEEADGRQFLTMEYLPGRTVRQRLAVAPLSLDDALAVVRQVARALESAHAKGVIHRDLKPSNVMLDESGGVKVLDFGLALRLTPGKQDDAVSATTRFAGTPGYMCPEQLRGETMDERGDVWALGCLLFECASGRRLVEAPTAAARVAATLALAPEQAVASVEPALPPPLAALLTRCLARTAADRPTMRDARAALEQLIADRALPRTASERAMAMRAATSTRGNVPLRRTHFIGRTRERAAVARLLDEHRVVTLTGAGGCGKSRLAVEVASDLADRVAEGVWLAELSPIEDGARVAETVLVACGGTRDAATPPLTALTHLLRDKDAIVVLDNCEHVLDASAALVEALLGACPAVRMLATSRERLRVDGEAVLPLAPLAAPRTAAEAAESEAVQLFVARARAVHDGFALTAGNAPAIADICRRLDGIPLALELAAARVKTLPPEKIRDLLDDRFRLLTHGTRTAAPHQATLRALIDWSYDRLEPLEQVMLQRLSVFRGVWTLEGVEAVAAGGDLDPWDALDLFTHLVEKSLVVCDLGGEGETARYSLLETVRAYAADKLHETPEEERAALARHRAYVLALVAEGCEALRGPAIGRWMPRLADAQHDVHAVADRLADDPAGGPDALALLAHYGLYWLKAGRCAEGREEAQRVLARPDLDRDSHAYGMALLTAGNFGYRLGDLDGARAFYLGARAVFAAHDAQADLGKAYMNLGNLGLSTGAHDEAEPFYEQAIACFRAVGSTYLEAGCLSNLAAIALNRGDDERIVPLATQSIALYDALGVREPQVLPLFALGHARFIRGEVTAARPFYVRALEIAREVRHEWLIVGAGINVAMADLLAGDREASRAGLADALRRLRDVRDPLLAIDALEAAAQWMLPQDAREAAWLFGAAAGARETYHAPPTSAFAARVLVEASEKLAATLGAAEADAARAAGAVEGWEPALAAAVRHLAPSSP